MAILSWDSEIASSVPSNHEYFVSTLSKSISNHLVSSQTATDIPHAQKSLHLLMNLENLGFKNSLVNFPSSTGLPFCTSAQRFATELKSCSLDAPAAAWIPSLPVLQPIIITLSHLMGTSLLILAAGAHAITYPTSKRFALNQG